jgi:hypothetical protein
MTVFIGRERELARLHAEWLAATANQWRELRAQIARAVAGLLE